MAALLNRARMTTATTGTGTVTLGSAVTGYASFAEAGAVNATVYSYCLEDGDDFEIGVGTYTSSGTTFSRDTVTLSKISGTSGTSKINLSGTAEIFITLLTADVVQPDRQVASGNGLTGGGDLSANRTLAVGAGTGIVVNADDVAVDKATDANVRSAASNKVITADLIESASAGVALTDATTVAVDWDAGFYFTLTVTNNRTLGNPTNGQPGTYRTIFVNGNSTTDRTLSFGNQYLNVLPTLTNIDSAQAYILTIFCVTTTHFVVTATKATNF